ncbi:hypothetical protein Bca52824_033215 [Brassica carinata]|uniref:F-box domain-containing protein n=1 Tax=Brassica carinata TaxID=52824 RepID=A0A8X7SCF5_BRACI|nr:hypothetical protein Bca52824_033215 [Brassica carinata]
MAAQALSNLPDEIMCKIIELLAEESFYNLAAFLRAGKRGYALVHDPSVLKICDVTEMVTFVTCQISQGGQFRPFLLKCVDAENINAIYYKGINAASRIGLEESIQIMEPNVPIHGLSTLAVGIFNVCLGNAKEASKVFQQFAAYHHDLGSDATYEMETDLEW